MTLPNFFLIGANKAGTTAMYHALRRHPEVYMSPVKEPMFFSFYGESPSSDRPDRDLIRNAVSTISGYRALFAQVDGQRAVSEASTGYLYDPRVPARIKRDLPEARLIAILRDPSERAFSNYLYFRMVGLERARGFRQGLNQQHGPRYVGLGLYAEPVQRYYDVFGAERIRIYLYEDWETRPLEVIRDVFRFLEVDERFRPDASARHNESVLLRSRLVEEVAGRLEAARGRAPAPVAARLTVPAARALRAWNRYRPRLGAADRRTLVELYREDILKLQYLVGRDLSAWLRC